MNKDVNSNLENENPDAELRPSGPKNVRTAGNVRQHTSDSSDSKGEFLPNDTRERIKRCIIYCLVRPNLDPDGIQLEVAYSMLDTLDDDHLLQLDAMIHDYEAVEVVN